MTVTEHKTAALTPVEMLLDDQIALMRAAQADLASFAPLYDAFFPRIYAYFARRVAVIQDVEDLTSQVFARALKGIASYRGGSVAAWLFRIARNTLANYYRQKRALVSLDTFELAENSDTLIERLCYAEDMQRIRALIGKLSASERELIELRLYDGLTTKEIAHILGKREGAVKMRLSRLYKRLRVHFLEDSL